MAYPSDIAPSSRAATRSTLPGSDSSPAPAHAPSSYVAFISYSHVVDGRLAPALHAALQVFGKRWYRRRACRVFHDQSSLSANPDLWSMVERALGQSDDFIPLASPEAARSRWVAREVDWWLAHPSIAKLLIVLTDGDLLWNEGTRDFDWGRTTALPANLRGLFTHEPYHVDCGGRGATKPCP